jgi:hypothetical protein
MGGGGNRTVAIVERVQSGEYLVEMLSQLRQLLDEFRQGRSGRRASIRFSVRNLAHRRPAASLLAALQTRKTQFMRQRSFVRKRGGRFLGQPHLAGSVAREAILKAVGQ